MAAQRIGCALCFLLAIWLGSFFCSVDGGNSIGVNWGNNGNNLPTPEATVALILKTTARKVKLYDANTQALRALANSGLEVVIALPNQQIEDLSRSVRIAQDWVYRHVAVFRPATNIRAIAVGNEVLTSNYTTDSMRTLLLPAMYNIHAALVNLKLDADVKVTTPHSLLILAHSFPPSVTSFDDRLIRLITPIAAFLQHTGSYFMVNVYPYFAYRDNPNEVDLLYAMGQGPNPGQTDNLTGIHYNNLFSAQVDAVYYALKNISYTNLLVVVSESGWPHAGDANEPGCNIVNAQSHNYNLVHRVASENGTPARPDVTMDVYLFSLYDENQKPGPGSERNFGLFYPSRRPVYDSGILGPELMTPPGPELGPEAAPSPTSGGPVVSPPAPELPPPLAPESPVVSPPPPTPVFPPPELPPPTPVYPPPTPVLPPPPPVLPPPTPELPPPVPELPPPAPELPPPAPELPPPAPVLPPPVPELSPPDAPVFGPPVYEGHTTWCVAKPGADAFKLQDALNYACSQANVDCTPIQAGGQCFLPDQLVSHTSYAMNQYYQLNGRHPWNCFFEGNSVITITNPSTQTCTFSSG